MHGKIGQVYNVAGQRKNKEDKLNQRRPLGRNLKENNGPDRRAWRKAYTKASRYE